MTPSSASRRNAAGNILIVLAILLWAGAWARLLHTHLTTPSPARYTEFYTAAGPIDPPSWPHCHGPRLIVDTQVWQHCDQIEAAPAGFVRFDLSTGRAHLLWPVEGDLQGRLLGAALAPDGSLIAAGRGLNSETAVWRLRPEGGVEALGGLPGNLLALRVVNDHLEAITAERPNQATHHRRPLNGAEWISTPLLALPQPPVAPDGAFRRASVDAASYDPGGWTLWAIQQGADGTAGQVLVCPPGGPWTLRTEHTHGFSADGRRSTRLDRSQDGAISPYGLDDELLWLTRTARVWGPLDLRPADAGDHRLGSNVAMRLTSDASEGLFLWRGPHGEFTRLGYDRWLGLAGVGGSVYAFYADLPSHRRGPLTRESWLISGATFVPQADGYTVLGTFGTYIRLDENLERTDHLGLFARIAHFAHFRRFAWYNDTWLDYAPLKMATLPVLLLGLPLFLLPGLIRRRRPSPSAAALWLLLALGFAWHFWYFTAPRWF